MLLASDKKSIQELERLKNAAKHAREPFDREWLLNAAFFVGQQYVSWNGKKGALDFVAKDPNTPNAPRPVANKIMHYTIKSHAEAMTHNPVPEVMAPSTDAADRSEARVSQAYLDDLAGPTKANWEGERARALMWAVVCGEAWYKWVYDPQKKRPDVVAVSPLDVYLDPYALDAREARYIIHSQFLDREQVYDRYDRELPDTATESMDTLKANVLSEMGFTPNLSGVVVNELWQLPSRRYPRGRFVVWTGSGTLLTPIEGGLPYEHCRGTASTDAMLPFTQLGYIMVPGQAHFHSPVKFLRPAQMELNAVHAQSLTSRKAAASPKWFYDAELWASLMAKPTDAPNELLIGDSRGGTMQPVLMQQAVMLDDGTAQWITKEMGDIVGIHAVSEGTAPGRVDSAKALELLKAEDMSTLSMLGKTQDQAVAVGFYQLLQLARQYVTEDVIATTYTAQGVPEVRKFKARKVSPAHIVRVAASSTMPQSRAAREEQLLSWWTAGIITDPRQMMELLEVPYAGASATAEQDTIRATNENFLMSEEIAVTPNDFDDHDAHIREHNAYRKTAEYEAASDQVHDQFEFHIEAHEKRYMIEMQTEATKQKAIQAMAAPTPDELAADPALAPEPAAPVQAPA